jgi:aspartate/methionine/tyrosine aminotransferase
MGVTGDAGKVRPALRALELISDTFLPVNEIVQAAAPQLLQRGGRFLDAYVKEIRRRWEIAREFLEPSTRWNYSAPDGGFYLTLRLQRDEEAAAEAILRRTHTLVHPGYFYDIEPHHLVLSFVSEPESMRRAFPRLLQQL